MADADALLIRKLIVAALEGGERPERDGPATICHPAGMMRSAGRPVTFAVAGTPSGYLK
jgi:hypothetical protein